MKLQMAVFLSVFVLLILQSCKTSTGNDNQDMIPPTVQIVEPAGNFVSGEIKIICYAEDNETISHLELWIDGDSTGMIDNEAPYYFSVNTSQFVNRSSHTFYVNAYDEAGNKGQSKEKTFYVRNDKLIPTKINFTNISYSQNEISFIWQKSNDKDFNHYKLLYSDSINGLKLPLVEKTSRYDTTYKSSDFDPRIAKYYWLYNYNDDEYFSESDPYLVLEPHPTDSPLNPIAYQNGQFIISWIKNTDDDFASYELYESNHINMDGKVLLYTSMNQDEDTYTVTGISRYERRYYQLIVKDDWGLATASEIESGSSHYKILFISEYDLYSIHSDGKDKELIIEHKSGGNDIYMVQDYQVSPDGSMIIYGMYFYSFMFLLDPERAQINSSCDDFQHYSDFSPDCSHLVAWKDNYLKICPGEQEILSLNNGYIKDAKFHPNGQTIVFISNMSGSNEIYTIDSDGTDLIQITENIGYMRNPIFSPDGSHIYFEQSGKIFMIENDGSNKTDITRTLSNCIFGEFSPMQNTILFSSNNNIYVMDLNGSNTVQLTSSNEDFLPSFSPDGMKIVFESDREDTKHIYIMNSDGNDQEKLSYNFSNGKEPSFIYEPY